MDAVNPDVVDNEVGNIWRQLYKLEKGFENVPAAKKIATKVSAAYGWLLFTSGFGLRSRLGIRTPNPMATLH